MFVTLAVFHKDISEFIKYALVNVCLKLVTEETSH